MLLNNSLRTRVWLCCRVCPQRPLQAGPCYSSEQIGNKHGFRAAANGSELIGFSGPTSLTEGLEKRPGNS